MSRPVRVRAISAEMRALPAARRQTLALDRCEPSRCGSHKPPGAHQLGDERLLDRPAEPLRELVLVHQHRGAHAENAELGERRLLGRAPGLVPSLVPPTQLARVAMATLAVVDL